MISVTWRDLHREPTQKPNPKYPNGIDLDISRGAKKTCTVTLPYPAKRCGLYLAKCGICGLSVMCTTAGRADDPRSLKVACKPV